MIEKSGQERGRQIVLSSKDRETQLGVIGTPRQGYKYMSECYDVIMTSPGLKPPVMS